MKLDKSVCFSEWDPLFKSFVWLCIKLHFFVLYALVRRIMTILKCCIFLNCIHNQSSICEYLMFVMVRNKQNYNARARYMLNSLYYADGVILHYNRELRTGPTICNTILQPAHTGIDVDRTMSLLLAHVTVLLLENVHVFCQYMMCIQQPSSWRQSIGP